ncbi:MAG: LysR family transcriptional regulator [Cypionkella sp.]
MQLEWLEDILAIAQTGSFSGAAESRRLTQSAFSRRVKQIEDHVGVELFDRSHKPVVLRPTTLAQCEQIAHLAASLRQLVIDLRRGDRISNNKIVIASQHSLTTSLAPSIIQGIRLRGDETFVRLRSANLDECFGMLLSRQADIAIFYLAQEVMFEMSGAHLDTITIGADRLIPVFARVQYGSLGAAEGIAEMPYVAYPNDVFFGKVMDRKILPLLPPTIVPVPMAETALTLAALEMATVGVAVAWVPQSLASERISTGRLLDLSKVLPSCDLHVKAARLLGASGSVETAFWSQLLALKTTP